MPDSISSNSPESSCSEKTDSNKQSGGIKDVESAILEGNYLSNEDYERFELMDSDIKNLIVLNEDDPKHPFNWGLHKKIFHTVMFGLTTFCSQICSTVTTGNIEQLSREFHVGLEISTLAYCIFLLGNIPGPVLFAPVSELFGRRIGVMIPLFTAGVLVIISANLTSMWALIVLRFVSGVFAAAPLVNAGGAMADLWRPKERVAALVLYAMMIVLGSVAAPLIGASLATTGHYGWRWGCWVTGLFTIVVSIVNWFVLSECFVPVLEGAMSHSIRVDKGRWAAHAKLDEVQTDTKDIVNTQIARPIKLFLTPIVFAITLYSSFVYGCIFLLIDTVGDLFAKFHHFTSVTSTLPLYSVLVGFFIGGVLNILNAVRYGKIGDRTHKAPAPEEFLGTMVVFGWVMPAGFFIYGWTFYSDVHWIAPVIGLAVIGCGFAVIFQSCLIYLVAAYPIYAASVLASNTMIRSMLAGSFPLFGRQMYDTLNPRWASSLLGFLCVAAIPIPWGLYKYGGRLRSKSTFGTSF